MGCWFVTPVLILIILNWSLAGSRYATLRRCLIHGLIWLRMKARACSVGSLSAILPCRWQQLSALSKSRPLRRTVMPKSKSKKPMQGYSAGGFQRKSKESKVTKAPVGYARGGFLRPTNKTRITGRGLGLANPRGGNFSV